MLFFSRSIFHGKRRWSINERGTEGELPVTVHAPWTVEIPLRGTVAISSFTTTVRNLSCPLVFIQISNHFLLFLDTMSCNTSTNCATSSTMAPLRTTELALARCPCSGCIRDIPSEKVRGIWWKNAACTRYTHAFLCFRHMSAVDDKESLLARSGGGAAVVHSGRHQFQRVKRKGRPDLGCKWFADIFGQHWPFAERGRSVSIWPRQLVKSWRWLLIVLFAWLIDWLFFSEHAMFVWLIDWLGLDVFDR